MSHWYLDILIKFRYFILGYGRVVARSTLGKVTTIICAITMIPGTTASYSFIGRALVNTIQLFIISVECKLLKHQQVIMLNRKTVVLQVLLTIGTISCHGTIYFFWGILIPDNSTILDAIYFSFISVSTIGFGDIIYDLSYIIKNILTLKNITFAIATGLMFMMDFALLASLISFLTNLNENQFDKKKSTNLTKKNKQLATKLKNIDAEILNKERGIENPTYLYSTTNMWKTIKPHKQ